jgi:flavin-dependent dehydrogenase
MRMAEIQYSKNIPVLDDCDVLVVGGGSAGSSTAIAAARNGAKVILLERYGFLGGTGTAGLDTFYGFYTPGTVEKKVVVGIPDEVIAGLERHKALIKRPNTYGAGAGLTYDPEVLKVVWDDLVSGAGVRVLFHAYFADVIQKGPQITGAIIGTKRGQRAIHARVIIDTSGDADVIARAGAPFEDAAALGIAQSLTTTFKVINVVVVAGRCLSASHEAHASIRSIGQCMAMGQAAGVAVALAKNGTLSELEIPKLRERLLEMGGML